MENIGVEWQHCPNQLFVRFSSAVSWNKKQPKKLVQPCHFHCFLSLEIAGGDAINQFLFKIGVF
jgi:hypothetical protein